MCGIVGYIGSSNGVPVLIDGLEKLEYRGYDSAGIAYLEKGELRVEKALGKLVNLKGKVEGHSSQIGIGHTRWATHGQPSQINSHPHLSFDGKIAVVHNGIIENYAKIKEELESKHGIEFVSETDTEVIAHLVAINREKSDSLLEAVKASVDLMEGAYALGIIEKDNPDEIVAVRKDSPLIVGLGENEKYLASDVPAIIKYTRDVIYIDNDQFVNLTKDGVEVFDKDLNPVEMPVRKIEWDVESAEKDGFDHFTLKEIYDQPKGLRDTILTRVKEDEINIEFSLTKDQLESIDRVYIVACGTAYHAGLYGKYLIENLADIPVQVEVASEFKYTKHFINENSLFIAVSQSGETLDTLHALRKAKEEGAKVLSMLNVVGSSIARESDEVFYTWAGPEIGVASTKAYTTQIASFALIALKMARLVGRVSDEEYSEYIQELRKLPDLVEKTLELSKEIKDFSKKEFENEKIFFIGRGLDYYSSLEASLKLKEISYINSFAVQAGELKHGTIALVEDGSLAVAFVTQDEIEEKMISNIKEVKARGAKVLLITKESNKEAEKYGDYVIAVPDTLDSLVGVLSIIPAQLFAYHVSNFRGTDVDKPRNLAKSVTVE